MGGVGGEKEGTRLSYPPLSLLIFLPFSSTPCHTQLSECLDQASGIQRVDPSWSYPGRGGGEGLVEGTLA